MTDNTELLPVTQEDIAMALEHLGYDSIDDLHYWAENDTVLRRFDELCSRFARHRLNTRPTQCYHGDCGEYTQGKADGQLVQFLWNKRRTILTALRSRPSGDGEGVWQPIESAPYDENVVLLYAPSCGVYEGYRYNVDGNEWTFLSGSGEEMDQPTHWQPFPEPPTLSTKDTGQ